MRIKKYLWKFKKKCIVSSETRSNHLLNGQNLWIVCCVFKKLSLLPSISLTAEKYRTFTEKALTWFPLPSGNALKSPSFLLLSRGLNFSCLKFKIDVIRILILAFHSIRVSVIRFIPSSGACVCVAWRLHRRIQTWFSPCARRDRYQKQVWPLAAAPSRAMSKAHKVQKGIEPSRKTPTIYQVCQRTDSILTRDSKW